MTETHLMEQLISAVQALESSSTLDVVIAVASPLLALAAVFISVYTARKQNAIALFDKRYEIYSKIHALLKTGSELAQKLASSEESSEASSEGKHCILSLSQQLNLLSVQLFASPQLLQRRQTPRPTAEPCADDPLPRLDRFFRRQPQLDVQSEWISRKTFFQEAEASVSPADILDADAKTFPVAAFLTSLQSVDRLADQSPLLFPSLSPERVEALQSTFDIYVLSLLGTYAAYSDALPNTLKRDAPPPQGSFLLELYAPYAALPLEGTDVTPEKKAALLAAVMAQLANQLSPLFSALSPEQTETLRSTFDSYALSLLERYAPYALPSLKKPEERAATPEGHDDLLSDVMQRLTDQVSPLFSTLSPEQTETLRSAFDSYALSLLERYAPYALPSLIGHVSAMTAETLVNKCAELLSAVEAQLDDCQRNVEALEDASRNLEGTRNEFVAQCQAFEQDCLPTMREILSPSSSWLKRTTKKIRHLF